MMNSKMAGVIFLMGWIWILGIAVCGAQDVAPAPTQQPSIDDATREQDTAAAENRQRLLETLLNELAALTPGNLEQPAELKSQVSEALSWLLDNKLDQARQALEKLTVAHRQLPPVDLQLAAIYFALNNPAEGSRLLEEAATVNPDLPTIYTAFARVAILQRRRTDALALLEKSKLKIDSKTWSEEEKQHFELSYIDAMADLMILRRDFGQARKYLEQVSQRRPDDSRAIMRLAEVDFAQDEINQCFERLKQVAKLNANSRVPELILATLYAGSGRMPEADEWVERARTTYASDEKVLLEYAGWMLNREKFDLAAEALKTLETAGPVLSEAKLMQAKIAFAQQAYEEAEKLLGELRVSEPGNADVANLWAMALAESTDSAKLSRALEVAAQNAQLQPQNPIPAAILGWVLFKQNQLPQAQEWLNRAAQAQRLTPEVAYFFSKFLQAAGEKDRALQLVTQALEQPGLFLYRTPAREFRKQLQGGDLTPKK